MADEAIINIRFDTLAKDCEETKCRVSEAEDAIAGLSDRTRSLEYWRNGNGASGAEERLQAVEDGLLYYSRERIPQRLNCVEADMAAVQRIADHAIEHGVRGAVNDTLDKRDKTAIAKIKAWGPYFATGVVLILGILERIFK